MRTLHLDLSFLDLIEETYALWDQPMPDIDQDDDEPVVLEIEVEKARIVLSHLPQIDPDHFTMYCTLGPLPSPSAPAMKRALEMNAVGSQTQGGIMAVNPGSSEMVMILRVALLGVDPASLIASMTLLARRAAHWKKSHFLDEPMAAKVSAPTGKSRGG